MTTLPVRPSTSPGTRPDAEYRPAVAVTDLPPGHMRQVTVHGVAVAVYHTQDGQFYATQDTCTHEQASLSEGYLDDCTVECPLHGALFDVRSGEVLALPAFSPLVTYPTKVEDGTVWVCVDRPPRLP